MAFAFDYYLLISVMVLVVFALDVGVYKMTAKTKTGWPFTGPWSKTHMVMAVVALVVPVANFIALMALLCFFLVVLLSYFTEPDEVLS